MKTRFRPKHHAVVSAIVAFASVSAIAQTSAPTDPNNVNPNPNGANAPNTGSSYGNTGVGTTIGTPSGTTSGMSNTGSNSGSTYGNTMQPLPTEPTAAGYSPTEASYESRSSWLPYTTSGYISVGVGNGNVDTACVVGQNCDDPSGVFTVSTGGLFNPYVGMQLGYFRMGKAERNGGDVKASGVSLVLTGIAPLGSTFSANGRIGGTYAWTETTVGAGVPAPSGKVNGFGPTIGVGLNWDFHRNWSASLDWDRHRLKYAGDTKHDTDVTTIGLKYRF